MNKGTRIGAILSGNDEGIKFLGYGTYEGDEVPPAEVSDMLHDNEIANPKLVLDSGDVVWGCECWWGPEKSIEKRLEGQKIIFVRIADERQ